MQALSGITESAKGLARNADKTFDGEDGMNDLDDWPDDWAGRESEPIVPTEASEYDW
jgi:hypothetical protein